MSRSRRSRRTLRELSPQWRQCPAPGARGTAATVRFNPTRRRRQQVRLEGKVAMVVGAGQAPGRMTGNGKATSMVFAREGAKVLCVDRDKAAAEETVAAI